MLLVFIKRYWYHLLLVSVTVTASFAVKGCISERDRGIRERAVRAALITRDSAQVAALRDSLVDARQDYDTTAKALRSALHAYSSIGSASRLGPTLPSTQRASIVGIKVIDNVNAATIISQCKDFVDAADRYKLYADSTMAAQARVINNLEGSPRIIVHKSSRVRSTAIALAIGVVGGYTLSKSF